MNEASSDSRNATTPAMPASAPTSAVERDRAGQPGGHRVGRSSRASSARRRASRRRRAALRSPARSRCPHPSPTRSPSQGVSQMSMRLALRYDMRAPAFGAPRRRAVPGSGRAVRDRPTPPASTRCTSPSTTAPTTATARRRSCRPRRWRGARSGSGCTSRRCIAVLHHPLRLAEDLAVLDLISGGRVEMTLGIGYRPHEYEMFGVEKCQAGPDPRRDLPRAGAGLDRRAVRVPRHDRAWSGRRRCRSRGRRSTSAGRAEASALPRRPYRRQLLAGDAGSARDLRRRAAPPRPARAAAGPGPKGPLFLFVTDDPGAGAGSRRART